jgi:hypothetical protein
MPTRLPRLNVTVSEEQHALLMRLGALQGRSAASYLRELLDASTPFLTALAPTLDAARAGELQAIEHQAAAAEDLARSLFASTSADQLDLVEHLASVLLSDATGGAVGASATPRGRMEHGGDDAPTVPPSSNTGVSSSGPRREMRISSGKSKAGHG